MTDSASHTKRARIFYARVDESARKEDKYRFLDDARSINGIEWQELEPDAKHNWLTQGMRDEFKGFLPMGTKEAKASKSVEVESIFKNYSLGVSTNRDATVYNFDKAHLLKIVEDFCDAYNAEVHRYQVKGNPKDIDDFLSYDKLKWSLFLKNKLNERRHG